MDTPLDRPPDTPHYVDEVMTYPVIAVQPGAAVEKVAAQLARRRIGSLPVVDTSLRVVGIVTETDLLRTGEQGWDTAGDVMSAPALTVAAGTTVGEVRSLLTEHRIGRLPVVDDRGRLVGIVSRRDLLAAVPSTDGRIRRRVVDRAVDIGAEIDSLSVESGVVRIRVRLADSADCAVLEHLLGRIAGVTRVEVDVDRVAYGAGSAVPGGPAAAYPRGTRG
ncbi:CBS domain-containing protein [Catenulispora sp. MAP5-51]|uniref:CBS domain-containing protein n=1 Tax=Catenulispora sp. MAP5-51 TaxID=3156298 RepID=UPI003512C9A0